VSLLWESPFQHGFCVILGGGVLTPADAVSDYKQGARPDHLAE